MGPPTETDFCSVTRIVLGRELSHHEEYGPWLLEHTRPPITQPSAMSGKIMYVPSYSYYTEPVKRAVTLEECDELGKKMLSAQDIEHTLSISSATRLLDPIKLYSPDVQLGTNFNMEKCGVYFWSSNCYNCSWAGHAKHCAYSMWPRNSEYCFGCEFAFSSRFCIKCYHSVDLTRCFEVSHSNSCSDCLFCHNCENVSSGLFCFNASAMRYAIFNVEVGPEKFAKVKALLLNSIFAKLEKDKRLDWNVFNIGCPTKSKK